MVRKKYLETSLNKGNVTDDKTICEILPFKTARPTLGLNPVVCFSAHCCAAFLRLKKIISAFKFFARSNLALVLVLFQALQIVNLHSNELDTFMLSTSKKSLMLFVFLYRV